MPTSITRTPVSGWFGSSLLNVSLRPSMSSPTDERHLRRHHGHELNVGIEGEAGHVHERACHILELDSRLNRDVPVRLRYTVHHTLRHLGGGVADVYLAAGDVVLAAVQRG